MWVLIFFFFNFSFWLCCPLRFENSPQIRWWEGLLLFGNFSSFTISSSGRLSVLTLLSLFLSFIFCPTSFRSGWAAFLAAWCPLPAFRSCFVEIAQHSNVLLMNLWGKSGLPFLFLHHLRTTFSLFLIEYLVWRSEFILFLAMNYTFVQLIIFKKPLWNSYGWSDKTS